MRFYSIIAFLALLVGCSKCAEPEIFLFQEDFNGLVIIFFNQEGGEGYYDENNTRVYEIPQNGVFKSQFKIVDGVLNQKFFYVDKNNKVTREILKIHKKPNNRDDLKENYVYGIFDGGFSINPETNQKIKFVYFTVGSLEKMEMNIKASHSKAENLIKEFSKKKINTDD